MAGPIDAPMHVALRHFLLDRQGALYRLPNATLDHLLQAPTRHRLPRFAGQRVRSAEVAVEMVDGQPAQVLRCVFNMVVFKPDGSLVPPVQDRHVRARAELALALAPPAHNTRVAEAGTRFLARGGLWKPPAALVRRIEHAAMGRVKCPGVSPSGPGIE